MNFTQDKYIQRSLSLFCILLIALTSAVETPARLRRTRKVVRPAHRVTRTSARTERATTGSVRSFADWTTRINSAEENLNEQWTVSIQDLDSTATVYEYQANRRLAPASNRKLITMGMALETLGPDYQFKTEFGLSAPVVQGRSHYHGDVILRSNGDPSMTEPFIRNANPAAIFQTWAGALSSTGIAYIHGNLVVDASAFGVDQNHYPDAWGPSHKNYSYAPIPSALTLCQNLIRVSVNPGSRSGLPGRVSVFPSNEGIAIVNNTRTGSRGRGGVSAVFSQDEASLVVSGSLSMRGGGEVATLPLPHPLQYIGQMLRQSIESAGVRQTGSLVIRTAGNPSDGKLKIAQRLGYHESPPLAQLLLVMMRQSNNFLAEQLWRASAAQATGCGNVPNARKTEQDWYRRHGLLTIEPGWDGSGLSRKDQFAAREMVSIARYLYNTAHRNLMLKVLPTSGRTGTLRHRAGGNMSGRVIAKTGTLAGVSSLTGFITDAQGHPRLVFSAIGNAGGQTHGRLATRINDLLNIAINRLDADISAGRRPRVMPDSEGVDMTPNQKALDLLPDGNSDLPAIDADGESAD